MAGLPDLGKIGGADCCHLVDSSGVWDFGLLLGSRSVSIRQLHAARMDPIEAATASVSIWKSIFAISFLVQMTFQDRVL